MKVRYLPHLCFALLPLAAVAEPGATSDETRSSVRAWLASQHYSPGDQYTLNVSIETEGAATSRSGLEERSENLDVVYFYEAQVTVTEVDEDGFPVAESHRGARFGLEKDGERLTFRPKGQVILATLDARDRTRLALPEGDIPYEAETLLETLIILKPASFSMTSLVNPPKTPRPDEDSWAINLDAVREILRRTNEIRLPSNKLVGEATHFASRQEHRSGFSFELPLEWIKIPMKDDLRTANSEGLYRGTVTAQAKGRSISFIEDTELIYSIQGTNESYPGVARLNWGVDYSCHRVESRTRVIETAGGSSAAGPFALRH
jgi:hypothetical protein